MFKIYSKGCEQVLRALSQIPPKNLDQNFLARDICRKSNVSETSTRKALQLLVQAGILKAVSGPKGGYKLAIPPKKVSLLDIIQAIDGEEVFDHCIMGLSHCSNQNPCPIHHTWTKMKNDIVKEMSKKTLDQLIKSTKDRRS